MGSRASHGEIYGSKKNTKTRLGGFTVKKTFEIPTRNITVLRAQRGSGGHKDHTPSKHSEIRNSERYQSYLYRWKFSERYKKIKITKESGPIPTKKTSLLFASTLTQNTLQCVSWLKEASFDNPLIVIFQKNPCVFFKKRRQKTKFFLN